MAFIVFIESWFCKRLIEARKKHKGPKVATVRSSRRKHDGPKVTTVTRTEASRRQK